MNRTLRDIRLACFTDHKCSLSVVDAGAENMRPSLRFFTVKIWRALCLRMRCNTSEHAGCALGGNQKRSARAVFICSADPVDFRLVRWKRAAPRRVWDAGVKTEAQASERHCIMHIVTVLRDILLSKHIFYVLASR